MERIRIKEFMENLAKRVVLEIGNEVDIKTTEVLKNNSVRYHGLVISRGDSNVSPTVYVDGLFSDYIKGRDMDDIVLEIINTYHNYVDKVKDVEIEYGKWIDFENIKDKIFMKLVNYNRNLELLDKHPYVKYYDLAITFHINVENTMENQASVRIDYELMRRWGLTTQELYEFAKENTIKLFPLTVKPINDVIIELINNGDYENNFEYEKTNNDFCDIVNEDNMVHKMFVMTNSCCVNGAVCLVYKDFIREFAKEQKCDIVMIPSSVHELICITNVDKDDYLHLIRMVNEVNATHVMPEEILSDNIYIYNKEMNEIESYIN